MNKIAGLPGILFALIGWALVAASVAAMLSGPYEGRTCQTACVQWLFFSGTAAAFIGLTLGLSGLRLGWDRLQSQIALWLAGPLCFIVGSIIVIGNLA